MSTEPGAAQRNDSHFRDLSQTIPDFICQLESLQNFAEDSVSEALSRLEMALENIDAIGRLLPPGEFKAQFDLDRSVLATQLNLAKDGLEPPDRLSFRWPRVLYLSSKPGSGVSFYGQLTHPLHRLIRQIGPWPWQSNALPIENASQINIEAYCFSYDFTYRHKNGAAAMCRVESRMDALHETTLSSRNSFL